MRTAYKCRAYPDPGQAAQFSRTFGCVRLAWNKTLAARHEAYHQRGEKTSYKQTDAALTEWKRTEGLAFLSEVSSVPLQQTLRHQHTAFANFFAGRAKYPRFKNRNSRQSAHCTRSAFRMRNGELTMAKTKTPLAFVWTWEDVDLGIKDFAVTSDGERIANPRHLARKARNLARYQRRLARCQRGSMNRRKAKAKVARAHRKVRHARQDFLHRTTANLVRQADTIVIEHLNVKGAMSSASGTLDRPGRNVAQKSGLNRAIADCGWGEFRRQLEYKCERAGRQLVVIDRWYPSSKTCSHCGHLLRDLSLSTRHWTCPACRTRHDRDINAAKNILAAGRAVARDTPGDACGAGVSRQGSSLPQPAMKQKPRAARRAA